MTKARRLSRADKIAKRLRGVKRGTGINIVNAVHVVNVYSRRVPVTLNGFLVSYDDTGVVFRHKKSNGSKKTRISTFPRSDVVEFFGAVGEHSSITVWQKTLLSSVTGTVARSKTGMIKVTDTVSGEITVIYPPSESNPVDIEVYADEDEKAQRRGSRKGAGKAKQAKDDSDDEEEFEEEPDEEEEDLDAEESEDDEDEEDLEDDEDDSEDEDEDDSDEDEDESDDEDDEEDEDDDSDEDEEDLEDDDEEDEDEDEDDEEDLDEEDL